jgi:hypothetical protein
LNAVWWRLARHLEDVPHDEVVRRAAEVFVAAYDR